MKKFLSFTLSLLYTLTANNLCAQDFANPVEYMDYISTQQENITKRYMSYASASAHGKKASKVEDLRTKLLDEVQDARMNIKGMPPYKGGKGYRDTAVNFMKLYYNVLNEDYSKIINMEEVVEQSYDEMEAYMMAKEMVDKKLEEGNKKMQDAQKIFAETNNIKLLSNGSVLEGMIKAVNSVNEYYNDLYLIFYKPYIQEVYLLKAIEKGNITGIEQSKSSLLKYTQEGLEKLNSIESYEGDNSLKIGCKNMLDFFVKEGEKITVASDYVMANERFASIKKEYEKKDEPTKDDVKTYNKTVEEVNKTTKEYNNSMNTLNKQRNESLNKWNQAISSFFDKNTPHYN